MECDVGMNQAMHVTARRWAVAASAIGLMAAVPSTAVRAGNVIELGYVVDVAGSTVLKASYRAEISDGSFEASLFGKTSGVSNMFTGYKMNLSASGTVDGERFIPGVYGNDRKKKGKKAKSTDVTWQPGGGVTVSYSGEVQPPPSAVASALGKSTSDPLTAILKMANSQQDKPCSGKYRVYDGKDVFDLALAFRKDAGNAMECKLTWTPVAGVAVDKGDTEVETYALTLGPVQLSSGKVLHVPLQVVGKTKGMTVTVSAASVSVDGQQVSAQAGQ